MKKVLYITFNEILGNTGGSLGQKKIYLSLKNAKEKELITFDVVSLDNNLKETLFCLKKNRFYDALSRFCGHSNFLFLYKRKIVRELKKNHYDILLLGNSRLGFIARKCRKYVKKIITHFDNIEYDYASNRMSGNKLVQKIELSHVYRDEKNCIASSDLLLFLSKRDVKRAEELYKQHNKDFVLFPVCLEENKEELPLCKKPKVLFTGSLNYGPNIESVKKCISIVSRLINTSLIIAGSSPSEDVVKMCLENKIETHFNFTSLEEFAHKGDILLIPSDHGAGMKVKVAEAMKKGLIVFGSKETFIGYEEAFKQTNGLVVCNNEEEFIEKLQSVLVLESSKIEELSNRNIASFNELYSIKKAFEIVEELVN